MSEHNTGCRADVVEQWPPKPSTHRLWRDVFRCVLSVFYQLFYYLEERYVLDPLSDTDLYCLHLVYKPKINEALRAFVSGWNHHALTTEHFMTPIQLVAVGSLLNSSGISAAERLSSEEDIVVPGTVEVPPTPAPLQPQDIEAVESIMNNLTPTDHYVSIYEGVRQFVYDHVTIILLFP